MRRWAFMAMAFLLLARPCGGLTTKTVNPGGGADYTSLNAAWASIPNPLVDDYKITCAGSTDDTTAANLDTRTLDGHTVIIEGDNTTGKPDETKYQIHFTASAAQAVTIACGSVTFRYIEVIGSATPYNGIYVTANNVTVEKNVVHGFTRTNYAGIWLDTGTTGRKIWNNVCYGNARGIRHYSYQATIVHNTCVGNAQEGIFLDRAAGYVGIVKNNLLSGNTTADYGVTGTSGSLTTACNYTSDATSPDGAGYQSKTFSFVDAGGNNYHLAASQDELYNCTDAGGDGPSDDVDGQTRASQDAGFDEIISAWSKTLLHHGALLCGNFRRRS